MKRELAKDPLALLQPLESGSDGGALIVARSMSLELALFLAQLTGSTVYTDNPAQWKHLHAHALSAEARRQSSAWEPLVQQIRKIDFTLESSPQAIIGIRLSVKLRAMRNTLRKI